MRTMKCTLDQQRIPATQVPNSEIQYNESILRVYDLENEGWRSFRMDSIQELILS